MEYRRGPHHKLSREKVRIMYTTVDIGKMPEQKKLDNSCRVKGPSCTALYNIQCPKKGTDGIDIRKLNNGILPKQTKQFVQYPKQHTASFSWGKCKFHSKGVWDG